MSQSPECAAVERSSDVGIKLLSSGVVSLDIFGQQLVSADFIANEALRNILDTMGITPTTKARKLLASVHAQVKVNKEKFKLFVSILENNPTLNSFLDKINAEYATELQRAKSHTKSPKVPTNESHLAKKGSAEAGKMANEMQDKLSALRQKMGNGSDDYEADEATFTTNEEFFFQTVNQLWSMIAEITKNVHKTKEYYFIIIDSVENQDAKLEKNKLTAEIKQLSHRIQKDLITLKKEGDQAPNTADFRMKKTQFTTISQKIRDVMSEYSQVQSEYRDKCKERIQRQLQYLGLQPTEDEVEDILDNPTVFTQQILIDTAQKRQALGEIEARHHEIIELEMNIKELHEMFCNLSLLVEEQDDVINGVIRYNVETAPIHVDVARKDVRVAVQYHKKNTRLRWTICGIVTCCISVFLVVLIIIISVVVSVVN